MPNDLSVLSYCGPAPLPSELLGRWNFDPVLLAIMALTALALYPRLRGTERAMLGAALVVLLVIFVSPLCALTVALFSARVVHHVLLVAIAAPMLAMALRRSLPGDQLVLLLLPLTLLHTLAF
jgi:putative membrane protein